jgi:hypothetical protein
MKLDGLPHDRMLIWPGSVTRSWEE